jgi:hypothetical protein
VVGPRRTSRRHRVADKLLGDARLCPTVRRTPKLADAVAWDLRTRAHDFVRAVDPALLVGLDSFALTAFALLFLRVPGCQHQQDRRAPEGSAAAQPGPRRADDLVRVLP